MQFIHSFKQIKKAWKHGRQFQDLGWVSEGGGAEWVGRFDASAVSILNAPYLTSNSCDTRPTRRPRSYLTRSPIRASLSSLCCLSRPLHRSWTSQAMEAAGIMKMMVVERGYFSLGNSGKQQQQQKLRPFAGSSSSSLSLRQSTRTVGLCVSAAVADGSNKSGIKKGVPNSNYVVPLDSPPNSSCLTRPLVEILRDLNKRVPDKIIKMDAVHGQNYIPWYHANRMLSFFAPGWCGEIRNILFSDDGNVTVVYRLTIRGSDGEAFRESCGTASNNDGQLEDAVAEAEAIAFCRACARFGLGLYLYHEDEVL